MKTFAIYQLMHLIEIEVTWIAAFDGVDALIKSGCYRDGFMAREM